MFNEINNCEFVGVFDANPEQAKLVASEFGVKSFNSIDELLANVKAVSIAATTIAHYEVAKQCFEKNIHVFVEKPITYLKPRRIATPKMSGWLQRELAKHLKDTSQQNAFVQFASRRKDAQIVPESNLTFEEVKPLLDDIESGHFVANITAWKQGIPKSHETAELIAANGAEDDPWTSPEF